MEQLIIRTLDFETTGFPPEADVVELGYVDSLLCRDEGSPYWEVADVSMRGFQKLFKPDREMSIEARATHHIKDSELVGATHHSEMPKWALSDDVRLYAAHNADFEMQFLKLPEEKWWVDTYKVALRLYPDEMKHNNQYLRYFLGLRLDDAMCMPPHRAFPDAYTTAHILAEMISLHRCTLKDMVRWTTELPYLTRVNFGMHAGKRYDEVPHDYLRWMIRQPDMEEAKVAAAKRALGLR